MRWRNRLTAEGMYDAGKFGAFGSRDAIQAAIDQSESDSARGVFIPAGTWTIDTRIDIPSSIEIAGAGRAGTILRAASSVSNIASAYGVIGGAGVSDVLLRDFCVDLQTNSCADNGVSFYPSTPAGLLGTRCSEIELLRLKVLGYNDLVGTTGYSVTVFRGDEVSMQDCRLDGGTTSFDGATSHEGASFSGCTNVRALFNRIKRYGNYGLIAANPATYSDCDNARIIFAHNIVEDCWFGIGGNFTSAGPDNAAAFTAAVSDTITSAGHGLSDGDAIRVTSTGTLPTGLSTNTTYYIINSSTDTFEVSTAPGGSAVDITGTGSGTHTWHDVEINTTSQWLVTSNIISGCRKNGIYMVTALQAANAAYQVVGEQFGIIGNIVDQPDRGDGVSQRAIFVDNQDSTGNAIVNDVVAAMNMTRGGIDTSGTDGAIGMKRVFGALRSMNIVRDAGKTSASGWANTTNAFSSLDNRNDLVFGNLADGMASGFGDFQTSHLLAALNMIRHWNQSDNSRIAIPLSANFDDIMLIANAFEIDPSVTETRAITGTADNDRVMALGNMTQYDPTDTTPINLISSTNKSFGNVVVLNGASTGAISSSLITSNSIVIAVQKNGTAVAFKVTPADGGATLTTASAVGADTTFYWWLVNPGY